MPTRSTGVGRGGKREGAGRPKGSINTRQRITLDQAAKFGELPIEYMLRVMNSKKAPDARRDEMAKAAAPYLHPRLATTTLQTPPDKPLRFAWDFTKLDREQRAAVRSILMASLAETGSEDGPGDAGQG